MPKITLGEKFVRQNILLQAHNPWLGLTWNGPAQPLPTHSLLYTPSTCSDDLNSKRSQKQVDREPKRQDTRLGRPSYYRLWLIQSFWSLLVETGCWSASLLRISPPWLSTGLQWSTSSSDDSLTGGRFQLAWKWKKTFRNLIKYLYCDRHTNNSGKSGLKQIMNLLSQHSERSPCVTYRLARQQWACWVSSWKSRMSDAVSEFARNREGDAPPSPTVAQGSAGCTNHRHRRAKRRSESWKRLAKRRCPRRQASAEAINGVAAQAAANGPTARIFVRVLAIEQGQGFKAAVSPCSD